MLLLRPSPSGVSGKGLDAHQKLLSGLRGPVHPGGLPRSRSTPALLRPVRALACRAWLLRAAGLATHPVRGPSRASFLWDCCSRLPSIYAQLCVFHLFSLVVYHMKAALIPVPWWTSPVHVLRRPISPQQGGLWGLRSPLRLHTDTVCLRTDPASPCLPRSAVGLGVQKVTQGRTVCQQTVPTHALPGRTDAVGPALWELRQPVPQTSQGDRWARGVVAFAFLRGV